MTRNSGLRALACVVVRAGVRLKAQTSIGRRKVRFSAPSQCPLSTDTVEKVG